MKIVLTHHQLIESDYRFYPAADSNASRGIRADEAEDKTIDWLIRCGYDAKKNQNPSQKGFDITIPYVGSIPNKDLFFIQAKQRTNKGKGWQIDNLRESTWNEGLVDLYIVWETDSNQRLSHIFIARAVDIYESKHSCISISYNDFNKCSQLGTRKVQQASYFIYDAKTKWIMKG